jgi:protein subunit release factor B
MSIRPEKQKALEETLVRLGIRREEVVEQFVRSRGPGGQKVNKTSTAVYLKHLPTGLEVKIQRERSQTLNRFLAWRLLAEKIEALREGGKAHLEQAEKIRKQKSRRLRRSKGKKEVTSKLHKN